MGGKNADEKRRLKRVAQGKARANESETQTVDPKTAEQKKMQRKKDRDQRKKRKQRSQAEEAAKKQPQPKKQKTEKVTVKAAENNGEINERRKYTVFVGQLPNELKVSELKAHFKSGGVAGKVTVRLLKDKETRKSRGMAFVELSSEDAVLAALKLHLTKFCDATINVERSGAGGKNKDAGTKKDVEEDNAKEGDEGAEEDE